MARRKRNPVDRTLGPWSQLFVCLVLDLLGMFTYLIPVLGELADVIYAPVQAAWVWSMVGSERMGNSWVFLALIEELLPFTDIIPSCTIAWTWKYASAQGRGASRIAGG